jgi:hypothetical protein
MEELGENANEGQCVDGLVVPFWGQLETMGTTEKVLHAVVYFSALCYLFVGVSIIADR